MPSAFDLHMYCTLPFLRQRQDLSFDDTQHDQKLIQKIRDASRDMRNETNRVFEPEKGIHDFNYVSSRRLLFYDTEALSITSITDGQDTVIDSAAWILLGDSSGRPPYYGVELDESLGFFTYQVSKRNALHVNGVWGWHSDYLGSAFHDSGVTVEGGGIANSTQTAITTSTNDSSTVDSWGQQWSAELNAGTVQIGHLVKWGENGTELARVMQYPNTVGLTVVRGVNGTTAESTVAAGTKIYIYEPPKDLQDICAQWAAYLFAQDSTDFGKIAISATGEKTVPINMKKVFCERLSSYSRVLV